MKLKILLLQLLISCAFLQPVCSATNEKTYLVEGVVRFANEVNEPACAIIIFADGQLIEEVDVQNSYPYRFRRKISVSDKSIITLQVKFIDPVDFAVDRDVDLIYRNSPKTITVRKIIDAVSISIDRAKKYLDDGMYQKAIDEVSYFYINNISFPTGQRINVTTVLASAYERNKNMEKAIEILKGFLEEEIPIKDPYRFELTMQLSKVYTKSKKYLDQMNLLDQAFKEMNFLLIAEPRIKTYFTERWHCLLNCGNYNDYKMYPLVQFSDAICLPENGELLAKWNLHARY
jgi:hypothetical protein